MSTYTLYPFQHDSIDWMLPRKYMLLALDPGLGKTICALESCIRWQATNILVICPASLILQWEAKCKEFGVRALILSYNKASTTHYAQLKAFHWDVVVIDESHFLKNHTAQRSKKILGKGSFLGNAKRVVLMTGTPVLNRPLDVYLILHVFAPELLGKYANYRWFLLRFCGYMGKGATNTAELADILQNFMFRRTKEQVLEDLPAIVESIIEVDADSVPDMEYLPTQRRILGMNKLKGAIGYIKDLLTTVDKVLIITYHNELYTRLIEEFSAIGVKGGMTNAEKDSNIRKFIQNESCNVLIGQINTLGYGVDGLQAVCDRIVFVETDWTPAAIGQSIDRLRRIGQLRSTIWVDFIVAKNSPLEDHIRSRIEWKREVIKEIVENDNPASNKSYALSGKPVSPMGITSTINASISPSSRSRNNGGFDDAGGLGFMNVDADYLKILERDLGRMQARANMGYTSEKFAIKVLTEEIIPQVKERLKERLPATMAKKIDKFLTNPHVEALIAALIPFVQHEISSYFTHTPLDSIPPVTPPTPTQPNPFATPAPILTPSMLSPFSPISPDEMANLAKQFVDDAAAAGYPREKVLAFYRQVLLSKYSATKVADVPATSTQDLLNRMNGVRTNNFGDVGLFVNPSQAQDDI